jgi:uncharacterized protein (DUF983 family)
MDSTPTRATAIGRGFKGHCPRCGGGDVFASISDLRDECPTCGWNFVREEGYWVGAMIVLFAMVEIVFGIVFVGGMLVTWPDVPWTALLIVGLVLNGVVPFLAYGWAKTVFLGLDLGFNPPRGDEATTA